MARRDDNSGRGRDTDDDAPWLAEAAPRPQTRVTRRSLFWTVVVLLSLVTVAAVGIVLLVTKKQGGSTEGYMEAEQAPLITAEPGPYKVPPSDPRGLAVEGQDQTIYAAGQGIDPGSVIDQSAMPEEPMPRPATEPVPPPRDLVPPTHDAGAAPPPATATKPAATAPPPAPAPKIAATPAPAVAKPAPAATPAAKPAPATAKPVTPKPEASAKPAAAAGKKPAIVQLGAFSSEEKANGEWARLAGKAGLAGFAKQITKIDRDGKTLYRLRASGGDGAAACAAATAAGAACSVIE